jgi:hypothetical protein
MKAFRVYQLDDGGLVVRARLVEARADEEAIDLAAAFGWSHWQLWRRSRLIRDFSAARRGGGGDGFWGDGGLSGSSFSGVNYGGSGDRRGLR